MKQLKVTKSFTSREYASLDKYLYEIGKEPLITADEEVVLAQKIKGGDLAALEKLTKANLRFVVSVAKQYQNQGLPLGDLINSGNLGLIKAAKRFDETRGFKFISYAVWWIRQAVLQALIEESRMVRLPSNQVNMLNKLKNVRMKLEQQFEREPTLEELATSSGEPLEDIQRATQIAGRHFSLDSETPHTDEGTWHDIIPDDQIVPPDQSLMNESLRKELSRVIAKSPPREAEILQLYFGLNGTKAHTLTEISECEGFHLSTERIRQLKEKALRRLRNKSKNSLLKKFL